MQPFCLSPRFSPRPWGSRSLEPYYPMTNLAEPIGEAWLTGPACTVETGPYKGETLTQLMHREAQAMLGPDAHAGDDYPLLIKLIFPTDKLSIQVHPDDGMAHRLGHPRGKTECWYVLAAEPGAELSLGLRRGATPQIIREAIAGNTLEQWLQSVPVSAGDMVFVDAGTVHAIGPGVVLLETQQQSDLTYRMYDYGRPRPLHVEQSLEAMRAETFAGKVTPWRSSDGAAVLIQNDFFAVREHRLHAGGSLPLPERIVPATIVLLEGDARICVPECPGGIPMPPNHAVIVPPGNAAATIAAASAARIAEILPGPRTAR